MTERGLDTAGSGPPRPRVSVLTPAYNAELTIVQSVTSALEQTMCEIEVIVVDDGSAQPVTVALEGVRDERVRVLRSTRNRGVGAARNLALASARAPLVAQLDADDFWHPRHLEQLLPAFEDPRVGLAYSNAAVLGHPRGLDRWIGQPGAEGRASRSVITAQRHPLNEVEELYRNNGIPAVSVVMRTSAARDAGGYPEWLTVGEDYALYMRLLKAGWRFSFLDDASAVYRWPQPGRGASFSRRRNVRQQAKLFAVLAVQSPAETGLWKRLARELLDMVVTHVPASLVVWRLLLPLGHRLRPRGDGGGARN